MSSTVKTMSSLTLQIKEPGRKVHQEGTDEARESDMTSSINPRPARRSVARTNQWTESDEGLKSYWNTLPKSSLLSMTSKLMEQLSRRLLSGIVAWPRARQSWIAQGGSFLKVEKVSSNFACGVSSGFCWEGIFTRNFFVDESKPTNLPTGKFLSMSLFPVLTMTTGQPKMRKGEKLGMRPVAKVYGTMLSFPWGRRFHRQHRWQRQRPKLSYSSHKQWCKKGYSSAVQWKRLMMELPEELSPPVVSKRYPKPWSNFMKSSQSPSPSKRKVLSLRSQGVSFNRRNCNHNNKISVIQLIY